MPLLSSLRRRREAIYATMRKSPETSWQRDLAQVAVLLALLALVVGVRAWWALENTNIPTFPR